MPYTQCIASLNIGCFLKYWDQIAMGRVLDLAWYDLTVTRGSEYLEYQHFKWVTRQDTHLYMSTCPSYKIVLSARKDGFVSDIGLIILVGSHFGSCMGRFSAG